MFQLKNDLFWLKYFAFFISQFESVPILIKHRLIEKESETYIMLDLVKKFFNRSTDAGPEAKEEESSHDIRIATCALLLEMSSIDGEFSESEREDILSILKKDYELSDEHAAALLDASGEKLENSLDLWRFASLINKNYSIEEKERVIEMIWHVAYADGNLDKHEDYLVHKLAKLLRLTHKQLIDAKLKVKESLEV